MKSELLFLQGLGILTDSVGVPIFTSRPPRNPAAIVFLERIRLPVTLFSGAVTGLPGSRQARFRVRV